MMCKKGVVLVNLSQKYQDLIQEKIESEMYMNKEHVVLEALRHFFLVSTELDDERIKYGKD